MTDAQSLTNEQAFDIGYERGYERGMLDTSDLIDLADDAIDRITAVLFHAKTPDSNDPIDHEINDAQTQWALQAVRRWRTRTCAWKASMRKDVNR